MSLTRQTQKVFASNADADQLAVFGTMKTGTPVYSSDLATLQSQEYTEGWSEALESDKAPFLEEMNAVQYGLSYQIAYMLQEGAFAYDINTNYSATSIVKVIDSNGLSLYRSLVDNNLGNSLSDTDYWQLIPIANVQSQLANKADKTQLDGTWTYKTNPNVLSTSTAIGTYDLTSTLAGMLPNDSNSYECLIRYRIGRAGRSSNGAYDTGFRLTVGNVYLIDDQIDNDSTNSNNSRFHSGQVIAIVGSNRQLKMDIFKPSDNPDVPPLDQCGVNLVAYRKLGA